MWGYDLKQEIFQLRDMVTEQGRDIVGLMLECERLKRVCGEVVEDIRMLGRMGTNICPVCAHHNHGEGDKQKCVTCIINRDTDNFEWRGVKNEDHLS